MFDPTDDIEELYRQAADRFELDNAQPDWNRFTPILDNGGVARPGKQLGHSLTRAFGRIPTAAWLGVGGVSSALIGAALYATLLSHNTPSAASGGLGAAPRAAPAGAQPQSGVAQKGTQSQSAAATLDPAAKHVPGGVGSGAATLSGPVNSRNPTGLSGQATVSAPRPLAAVAPPIPDKTLYNPTSESLSTLDPFAARTNPQLVSLRFARVPTRAAGGLKGVAGPLASPFDMGGWFYAGISVSPDFSFVGGQRLTKAGHDFGIVTGFRLTSRLNLQTGLNFSRKIYYTLGEKSGDAADLLRLPRFLSLQYVTGSSNLLEIPLTLQYAFAKNRHGAFFVSAGVSAYLLYRETFDFYAIGGVTRPPYGTIVQAGSALVLNPPSHLLSAYDFSAGYRWNVGKANLLLIEPYLKLPATGLGRLDIPVSSTGLNLTFAHAFH